MVCTTVSAIQGGVCAQFSTEAVTSYISAVDETGQYDVTYQLRNFTYRQPADGENAVAVPEMLTQELNRDVFLRGRGRRIERRIDKPEEHTIAIIDWKSVESSATSLRSHFKALSITQPGTTYLDYVDPSGGGIFLTTMLKDELSTVAKSPEGIAPPRGGLDGYEVSNRNYPGLIRIWFDRAASVVPVHVEWFKESNGRLELVSVLSIEEFHRTAKNLMLPKRGKMTSFVRLNANKVSPYKGYELEMITESAAFDGEIPDQLVDASSLSNPVQRPNGWMYHYPQAMIAAVKSADDTREAIVNKVENKSSWLIIVVALAAIAFGVYLFARGRAS